MKLNRHQKILELIKLFPINTQEELLEKLRAEGYNVTQSTVSRDIKSLRLQKALSSEGKYRYTAPSIPNADLKSSYSGILSSALVSVDSAKNIVVVKTHSGMASAACAAIDSMEFVGVVGSLAGDDTIFIACAEDNFADELTHKLRLMF